MEEADEILLLSLRQSGCAVPSDIKRLSDLTAEAIVAIVAKALSIITDGATKFSTRLPPSMGAKHRTCTRISKKIKELGYPGDCGYNQLLYPNERDSRKLLVWLLEQFPKVEEEQADEEVGKVSLKQQIRSRLRDWVNDPWVPYVCRIITPAGQIRNRFKQFAFKSVPLGMPKETEDPHEQRYQTTYLKPVSKQLRPSRRRLLAPSLVEWNTQRVAVAGIQQVEWEGSEDSAANIKKKKFGVIKSLRKRAFGGIEKAKRTQGSTTLEDLLARSGGLGTRLSSAKTAFTNRSEFTQEKDTGAAAATESSKDKDDSKGEDEEEKKRTEEEEKKAREAELEDLRLKIASASDEEARLKSDAESLTGTLRQLEAAITAAKSKSTGLEEKILASKKTLSLLPEATKNITELQNLCTERYKSILKLATTWESHRKPLLDEIRAIKLARKRRKEAATEMMEEMREMRQKMREMENSLAEKDDRIRALVEEYHAMPKETNRNVYTKRIMEIIRQLRQQKTQISKVIADVRDVQIQINSLTDKLNRTVAVTDDKMYRAAQENRKDPAYLESLRYVTRLREVFDNLIGTVTKVGDTINERRELDAKIEQLRTQAKSQDIQKIESDLQQVLQENQALQSRLP